MQSNLFLYMWKKINRKDVEDLVGFAMQEVLILITFLKN